MIQQNNTTQTIQTRLQEHYNSIITALPNQTILGVFLQGSQNYNLAYEESDIDSKAIILPNFNNFILNHKPTSTTHLMPNDEHVDLKDIRLMFDCFKKQNINFVEILFTEYKIINPLYQHIVDKLTYHREQIARYNNYAAVNCICGMTLEKYKALEHPYPSIIDKIEKFGYCSKQLHHIIRMNEFIKRYISGEPYATILIPKDPQYLIDVKRNVHTLEEARNIAKTLNEETLNIKNEYMKNNPLQIGNEVGELLNSILVDAIKQNFISEVREEIVK